MHFIQGIYPFILILLKCLKLGSALSFDYAAYGLDTDPCDNCYLSDHSNNDTSHACYKEIPTVPLPANSYIECSGGVSYQFNCAAADILIYKHNIWSCDWGTPAEYEEFDYEDQDVDNPCDVCETEDYMDNDTSKRCFKENPSVALPAVTYIECYTNVPYVYECDIEQDETLVYNHTLHTCQSNTNTFDYSGASIANPCDNCTDADIYHVKGACYKEYPIDEPPSPEKFIECSNGTPYLMSCPASLLWFHADLTCGYASDD